MNKIIDLKSVNRDSPEILIKENYSSCKHKKTVVDDVLRKVNCRICNIELDPIQVLINISQSESFMRNTIERYRSIMQKQKERAEKRKAKRRDL